VISIHYPAVRGQTPSVGLAKADVREDNDSLDFIPTHADAHPHGKPTTSQS